MNIKRNGENIELMREEVLEAYWEIHKEYLLEDAKRHFLDFVDNLFLKAYGFTFQDVVDDENSKVLKELSEGFSDAQDCNVAENDTWEYVVKAYMDEARNKTKNHAISENE